jgi:hypothetical protein
VTDLDPNARIAELDAAAARFRREARFGLLVQSVATRVMHHHKIGSMHHIATREVDTMLHEAAALMLETIYENDAELKQLREALDKVTAMSLRGAHLSPLPGRS